MLVGLVASVAPLVAAVMLDDYTSGQFERMMAAICLRLRDGVATVELRLRDGQLQRWRVISDVPEGDRDEVRRRPPVGA